MIPSLSVVHTVPSWRRNEAPALSSPPKPRDPPMSPSPNHLKPTGTSTSRGVLPIPASFGHSARWVMIAALYGECRRRSTRRGRQVGGDEPYNRPCRLLGARGLPR